MFKSNNSKEVKKEADNEQLSFEIKQNLLGFFRLLLEVDKRNNPEKYKKPEKENEYD